jgi:UDP-GlcNAc:undecaprenyl-phosphate/decaprenyl-phosphate GlcNAc-1-phosphate transferase
MQDFLHAYPAITFAFILGISTALTLLAIPSILHVARHRHLFDDLGSFRKQHDHGIPRLGGIAIFVSFTITSLLLGFTDKALPTNYLLCACIILFAMGLKDDLSGVNSSTKFALQFLVGAILVILGNVRITSLYGIFGINELSYIVSAIISILLITLIVNAFNLIDGIDGLASVTGMLVNLTFGGLFIYMHQYGLAVVSLAMVGATGGFLKYNLSPAKIFMGDTGSLLIGLISAVMAIKFVELNKLTVATIPPAIYPAPALVVAILIGPIFDTLRVFTLRIAAGRSPFSADRNHLHHRMLRLGFNHIQTTLILAGFNIIAIVLVFFAHNISNSMLIVIIFGMSMLFNWMITFLLRSKERESVALRNLFV